MVHVHEVIYDDIRIPHEVTYVLLRCALFVVHELILCCYPLCFCGKLFVFHVREVT